MTDNLSAEKRFLDIEENLKEINYRIAEAAVKSGRRREEIRLMAVTKTVEPVYINHALRNGVNLIGENKVQELLS
ncbi:MAG: YggS family pyridoxal phosphate-dependent enzyme, partial [Clostridia bacterium]|nr:YggS family pyridoxal phosphate-dependent enzyme [Clostridia bacterium]